MKKTTQALTEVFTLTLLLLVGGVAQAQTNTSTGVNALLNGGSAYNTADGYSALKLNSTGQYNTASGALALTSNTTGFDDTANGAGALQLNTTGQYNTASGYQALYSNTIGGNNDANGVQALYLNTSGNGNTANGTYALYSNTTGSRNIANGSRALFSNTTGSFNTGDGFYALYSSTGSSNTAIGFEAGYNVTTGSNNVEIGNLGASGDNATIRIGTQGTQTTTYIAGIQGTTVGSGAPVYVTSTGQLGTLTSSAKFKQDIHDMGNVSDALLSLRPVTYQYKPEIDPSGTPQFGLIAEEVEKVNPNLVVHDANHQIYTVRYEAVNAMLLNEFQKQHQAFLERQKEIDAMKAQLTDLKAKVAVTPDSNTSPENLPAAKAPICD